MKGLYVKILRCAQNDKREFPNRSNIIKNKKSQRRIIMILGACCFVDNDAAKTDGMVKMMSEIGYRYLEGGLDRFYRRQFGETTDQWGGTYPELYPVLKTLDKYKLRWEVGQHAFVGAYNPSGKQSEEDLEKVRDYMYKLISSTSDLNIETLVMGAGGARTLPLPDWYDNVIEQMADICKYAISPVLDEYGIILALEPLRKNETNMINRTDEGVLVAKKANVPNIKVMADLYHVAEEDTSLADFVNYKGYIRHSHMGKPQPRVMPSVGDGYDYKPFFDALRSANFNGRMSIEANKSCDDERTSLERAYIAMEPLL